MDINEAYKKIIEEISKNDNFFSETFEELKKRKPHLMAQISKITTTNTGNIIGRRSLLLSLIAYRITTLTENIPETKEVQSLVLYFNSAFNEGGDEFVSSEEVGLIMEQWLEVVLAEDKVNKLQKQLLRETRKIIFPNE